MPRGVYARSTKKLSVKTKKIQTTTEEVATLGRKVWEEQRTSILQKAIEIVGPANRGLDYGHPLDNFVMEAELMNVWLRHKQRTGGAANLSWKDIAIQKIIVKIVREIHRHKEDNVVDIAGYAWCLEEAFQEAQRREGKGENHSNE